MPDENAGSRIHLGRIPLKKILNKMKSVMEIYIKVPKDDGLEQFLSCWLMFDSPLLHFQKAFESEMFLNLSLHTMPKENILYEDTYIYYGVLDDNRKRLSSCPFGKDFPIIASIERTCKEYASYANLSVHVAPSWTSDYKCGGRYLLISSPRREYSGYVLHISHPEGERIWYKYVRNIVSYAIDEDLADRCSFTYDDDC